MDDQKTDDEFRKNLTREKNEAYAKRIEKEREKKLARNLKAKEKRQLNRIELPPKVLNKDVTKLVEVEHKPKSISSKNVKHKKPDFKQVEIELKPKVIASKKGRKKHAAGSKSSEEKRKYEREKKRKQREKMRADPEAHQKYLEKERLQNLKRKKEGKLKSINEMSKREQKLQRKRWRENSKKYIEQKKRIAKTEQFLKENTPPIEDVIPPQMNIVASINKNSGRKKVRRDRSKVVRELQKSNEKLSKAKALVDKWKKRYYKKIKENQTSPSPRKKVEMVVKRGEKEIKKRLLFTEALVKQLKNKAQAFTSHRDKQTFYKCLSGGTLKKYKCQKEAKDFLKQSERKYRGMTNLKHERKKKRTAFSHIQKRAIVKFLEEDDNSVQTPGKNDFIRKKKVMKQKRYLQDTLKNLHKKFCEKNFKISLSTFCRYRPWWIVEPTHSTRNTCLCEKHENMNLLFQKLKRLRLIKEESLNAVAIKLSCNVEKEDCMYRECGRCKGKAIDFEEPIDCTDNDTTCYSKWIKKENKYVKKGKEFTSKITVKESIRCTVQELKSTFLRELPQYLRHVHDKWFQFETLKELKRNLLENEVLIVADFSENYSCKYSSEVQSAHFGGSKTDVTLHTGVFYEKGNVKGTQFTTVCESNRHDAFAVWAHLAPILKLIKDKNPCIDTIHFQSDGPTSQYRNRKNFYLFQKNIQAFNFKRGSWNFTEPGHGKGTADGVGGQLKRYADRQVLRGTDIKNAKDLFNTLKAASEKVRVIEVTLDDIKAVEEFVLTSETSIRAFPNTRKIKQITWDSTSPDVLFMRSLSCFQCFKKCKHHAMTPEEWENDMTTTQPQRTSIPGKQQIKKSTKIGNWVAVVYDNDWFPGIVEGKESENLKISFMMKAGQDKFSWPTPADIQEVAESTILCQIPEAPYPISSRHYKISTEASEFVQQAFNDFNS